MARRSSKKPSHRATQVGDQVKMVLSEFLLDRGLDDPRMAAASMVTVTEVQMTPDLKRGRVYVSVVADRPMEGASSTPDPEHVQVLAALNAAAGALQRVVADRIRLRYTPLLEFRHDDSIRYGAYMENLIGEVNADDAQRTPDHDDD